MNQEHNGKFYTIDKLAVVTGVDTHFLRYLKFTKKIPFFQESPGGKILIPYDNFIKYLNRNTNAKIEE